MVEEWHHSIAPFCGGCTFSNVAHIGCTADPKKFRIAKGEVVPKYSPTVVRGLQGLFNAIKLWRKPYQQYRRR